MGVKYSNFFHSTALYKYKKMGNFGTKIYHLANHAEEACDFKWETSDIDSLLLNNLCTRVHSRPE
jgi:hypothetical protein